MSPVTELLTDRVADTPMMPAPRFDRAAVRAFAEALGVHHRTATFYPWRRLPNGRRVMHPAGHVVGLTDSTFARLEVANATGWDIALCLNGMSGKGHRAPDVLSVIVISADLDNGVPASWPGGVAPTVIVETSPAKFQAHWRLKDEMEIAAGGALRSAMVAALGGDTGANSANQGMRPFGSVNHKYCAPFLAGHAGGSGEAVAASALSGAYPGTRQESDAQRATQSSLCTIVGKRCYRQIGSHHQQLQFHGSRSPPMACGWCGYRF